MSPRQLGLPAWRRRKLALVCPERGSKQRDFSRIEQSHAKKQLVLVRSERENKQTGLHPPGVKSLKEATCPRPLRVRKQANGTSSAQSEVAQRSNLSSFAWGEEASKRDFVCRERRRSNLSSSARSEEACKQDFICSKRSHAKKQATVLP